MPNKGQVVKFDDIKKEAYLQLLREGGRRAASAVAVGVHRSTVVNHMKDDNGEETDFAREVSEAETEANELVVDALFQAAISGNTTAIQVWLYNRARDQWMDRRRQEVTGKGGGPIEHKELDAMPIKKLLELLKLIRGDSTKEEDSV